MMSNDSAVVLTCAASPLSDMMLSMRRTLASAMARSSQQHYWGRVFVEHGSPVARSRDGQNPYATTSPSALSAWGAARRSTFRVLHGRIVISRLKVRRQHVAARRRRTLDHVRSSAFCNSRGTGSRPSSLRSNAWMNRRTPRFRPDSATGLRMPPLVLDADADRGVDAPLGTSTTDTLLREDTELVLRSAAEVLPADGEASPLRGDDSVVRALK